jgi:hypothetical protein
MKYILAAAVFGLTAPAALAFEETTIGAGEGQAPAAQVLELPTELPTELPKAPAEASKGLNLTTPEYQLTPGTEVKIPGLGTVGVLPKLDFGLELLYGANEQKGPFEDKSNPDDVQLRGTIKHRF